MGLSVCVYVTTFQINSWLNWLYTMHNANNWSCFKQICLFSSALKHIKIQDDLQSCCANDRHTTGFLHCVPTVPHPPVPCSPHWTAASCRPLRRRGGSGVTPHSSQFTPINSIKSDNYVSHCLHVNIWPEISGPVSNWSPRRPASVGRGGCSD